MRLKRRLFAVVAILALEAGLAGLAFAVIDPVLSTNTIEAAIHVSMAPYEWNYSEPVDRHPIPIPEPATMVLLDSGCLFFAGFMKWSKKKTV